MDIQALEHHLLKRLVFFPPKTLVLATFLKVGKTSLPGFISGFTIGFHWSAGWACMSESPGAGTI